MVRGGIDSGYAPVIPVLEDACSFCFICVTIDFVAHSTETPARHQRAMWVVNEVSLAGDHLDADERDRAPNVMRPWHVVYSDVLVGSSIMELKNWDVR